MTGAKRATSIMLSAVMLMGSLLTPMTAFAQEAATEVDEVYEQPVAVTTEAIPMSPVEEPSPEPVPEAAPPEKTTEKIESKQEETEAPDYMVHLPSYMEAAWMVDESHVKKRNDDETILAYKAGDSVKISVSELEGFKLKEIKVIDGKKNEQEFTWESEETLVFLMPEKDLKGNELYRWTTTKDPYYIEMLPIGTYTLTEITAPSGYATAETVSFTVEDTGEIQKVDMKDIPISVEISKKDIADGPGGEELPGAHLTVKNENGDVVDDWISTKEPHKISMLPVGKYTLTEVTAPKGYEVAESITFEIADSGEVHKVTMYDSPKEETVDLTGKKKTITKGGGYTPATNGVTSVVTPPVKTGDDSPILLFVLLGLMAVLTGGLAVSLRRKGRIV